MIKLPLIKLIDEDLIINDIKEKVNYVNDPKIYNHLLMDYTCTHIVDLINKRYNLKGYIYSITDILIPIINKIYKNEFN